MKIYTFLGTLLSYASYKEELPLAPLYISWTISLGMDRIQFRIISLYKTSSQNLSLLFSPQSCVCCRFIKFFDNYFQCLFANSPNKLHLIFLQYFLLTIFLHNGSPLQIYKAIFLIRPHLMTPTFSNLNPLWWENHPWF